MTPDARTSTGWSPSIGAWPVDGGVRFRVWAPDHESVAVRIEVGLRGAPVDRSLEAEPDGYWSGVVEGLSPGARYRYVVDGDQAFPDPASRFQPAGVHGPSEVIDPSVYRWSDDAWQGTDLERLVIYEVHVGTATTQGTFDALRRVLPRLAGLGVTAIQVMPVSDFAGDRNWGYDGVQPFAPSRAYGRPDDLRALVDDAHRAGLAVLLDVVYNHFGPDGAYQGAYSRRYFTEAHQTPWGAAINLDGPGSAEVRRYFIESALYWLHEFHVDGFRLDATDSLVDESPRHFLAEYAAAVHDAPTGRRPAIVIAEDARNLDRIVRRPDEGGWGLDGVLADDFHHEVRSIIAGDNEAYYRDYRGSTQDLATILERGWLYTGQESVVWGQARGTDPAGIPLPRFAFCLQNHDQVGNRPFGDRLHTAHRLPAWRAASVLLLASATTPLLFMGQEWAASTAFQFFTDHNPELGKLVTAGRRKEFRDFRGFRDPDAREMIPDPQELETFEHSRLEWAEREREPHAAVRRLYRALLALRREDPAFHWAPEATQRAAAPDEGALVLRRSGPGGELLLLARLTGEGAVDAASTGLAEPPDGSRWELLLSTEDHEYAPEQGRPEVAVDLKRVTAGFARPGAVLLRSRSAGDD